MKSKLLLGCILVLALIVLTVAMAKHRADARADAEFAEQIRLAKSEGLPTSAQELAATIRPASPSENAAPIYRSLKFQSMSVDAWRDLDRKLTFEPSAHVRTDAARALSEQSQALALLDRGVALPHCWFDRDWRQGAAVLMPEFATMKAGAKLLALRGSYKAATGDAAGAIAEVNRMFRLGAQAGEEGLTISALVRDSICQIGLQHLAWWALAHRDEPAYLAAVNRANERLPKPNLRAEHRDELFIILSLVEQSETPEGMKQLGIKEGDVPAIAKVLARFVDSRRGKVQIVKAERERWAALEQPQSKMAESIDRTTQDLYEGLVAFPAAAWLYQALEPEYDPVAERLPRWTAGKQIFVAFVRALSKPQIPRTLDTSDLASPFDGKPLRYHFDGKFMSFTVSGFEEDGKSHTLTLPPSGDPH